MNNENVHQILDEVNATLTSRGKTYDKDGAEERSMAKTVSLFNQLTGKNLSELEGWQEWQQDKVRRLLRK